MAFNVEQKTFFVWSLKAAFPVVVSSSAVSFNRWSIDVARDNVSVLSGIVEGVERSSRKWQYVAMSLARADCARIWAALPDTKPVNVLEVEFSFEVDESVEMIAAIFVRLTPDAVFSVHDVKSHDKRLIWPVVTALSVREKEVSRSESYSSCFAVLAESSAGQGDARKLTEDEVLGESRIPTLVGRRSLSTGGRATPSWRSASSSLMSWCLWDFRDRFDGPDCAVCRSQGMFVQVMHSSHTCVALQSQVDLFTDERRLSGDIEDSGESSGVIALRRPAIGSVLTDEQR
jgi:hypothetical protein